MQQPDHDHILDRHEALVAASRKAVEQSQALREAAHQIIAEARHVNAEAREHMRRVDTPRAP